MLTLNAFKSRNCDVVERGQQCLELQERKDSKFLGCNTSSFPHVTKEKVCYIIGGFMESCGQLYIADFFFPYSEVLHCVAYVVQGNRSYKAASGASEFTAELYYHRIIDWFKLKE